MDRAHELSAVLADDTRYRIYRSITERPDDAVTVADVAERFSLHPNVARMHLTKLEKAGFLAVDFRRLGAGGRPAKLYRLSDMVVTFGFPPRRYELLSRLALGALTAGGSRDDALRVCREAGISEGRRAVEAAGAPPADGAAAAVMVRTVVENQGLLPKVVWRDGALRVVVRNCAFHELSSADPDLVCAMHRAYLLGILEVVTVGLGPLDVDPGDGRISLGNESCAIVCTFVDDGRRARRR